MEGSLFPNLSFILQHHPSSPSRGEWLCFICGGGKKRLINLSEILGDVIIKNLYLHEQRIQEAGTSTLWLREQRRELPHLKKKEIEGLILREMRGFSRIKKKKNPEKISGNYCSELKTQFCWCRAPAKYCAANYTHV